MQNWNYNPYTGEPYLRNNMANTSCQTNETRTNDVWEKVFLAGILIFLLFSLFILGFKQITLSPPHIDICPHIECPQYQTVPKDLPPEIVEDDGFYIIPSSL